MKNDKFNHTEMICSSAEDAVEELERMLIAGNRLHTDSVGVIEGENTDHHVLHILIFKKNFIVRISSLIFSSAVMRDEAIAVMSKAPREINGTLPDLLDYSKEIKTQNELNAVRDEIVDFQHKYGFTSIAIGFSKGDKDKARINLLVSAIDGESIRLQSAPISAELFDSNLDAAKHNKTLFNEHDDVSCKVAAVHDANEEKVILH